MPAKNDLVRIGLDKLDSVLNGGLPKRSSVLLIGPPKCGKTLFGLHFLFEGLSKDEYGIFIITNNFPEDIMDRFKKLGKVDPMLERGLLRFVDCYSIHAGVEKGNTMFIIRVNGPTALTEIGIAFTEILKKMPKSSRIRLVFDSVSTLLLYNSPKTIVNFIQKFNERSKASGVNSIFVLEEGMHDEKDVTAFNSLLDIVIHLKKEKDKNYIRVSGFEADAKPINYSIKDGRIKCN
jgi:KaiC/GvpD/RAD55 family RecA-like ATPase